MIEELPQLRQEVDPLDGVVDSTRPPRPHQARAQPELEDRRLLRPLRPEGLSPGPASQAGKPPGLAQQAREAAEPLLHLLCVGEHDQIVAKMVDPRLTLLALLPKPTPEAGQYRAKRSFGLLFPRREQVHPRDHPHGTVQVGAPRTKPGLPPRKQTRTQYRAGTEVGLQPRGGHRDLFVIRDVPQLRDAVAVSVHHPKTASNLARPAQGLYRQDTGFYRVLHFNPARSIHPLGHEKIEEVHQLFVGGRTPETRTPREGELLGATEGAGVDGLKQGSGAGERSIRHAGLNQRRHAANAGPAVAWVAEFTDGAYSRLEDAAVTKSLLPLMLIACTQDPSVNKIPAEPAITPALVDFGELVVGDSMTVTAHLENLANAGYLTFSDPVWSEEDPAFSHGTWTGTPISGGDKGELELTYSPSAEGGNKAVLQFDTDEETMLTVSVEMIGVGVAPDIEINPEQIAYGAVEAGSSTSEMVQILALGTGDLTVNNIGIRGGDSAFSWSIRGGCAMPCVIENGGAKTLDVVFAPGDDAVHVDELFIDSTDPDEPQVAVILSGNVVTTENTPPTVEILDPTAGESFVNSTSVPITGLVYDPDELATNLTCSWFANGGRLSALNIDADGTITGSDMLPIGVSVLLTLRCTDLEGAIGEDSVNVEVADAEQPLSYTISGGDSLFDYFSIDDDITFYLNGAVLYADTNGEKDTLAPLEFDARPGDTIRIVATDQQDCAKNLTGLLLHWGTGESQPLNAEICDSSCSTDACYSGSYEGPWPNTFLDETYTISIP